MKWMFGVWWETAKAVGSGRRVRGGEVKAGCHEAAWRLCLGFIPEDMPRHSDLKMPNPPELSF